MSKRSKQIECLNRLNDLTAFFAEVEEYLVGDRVVTREDFQHVRNSPTKGKELQALLYRLAENGKLQLLEYQWSLLPIEVITITMVTDISKKEFTYSAF